MSVNLKSKTLNGAYNVSQKTGLKLPYTSILMEPGEGFIM
jgi:hypothetical protein